MLSWKKTLLGIFLIISILYIPRQSLAVGEIGVEDSDINIETVPENPEPYQNVTITITSFSTDLNKATIEWRSGKNLVLSGIGKTKYSFTTLGPSTSTVFTVSITPSETGVKIVKQILITPSEIDLIWEGADTYTPPFYKGKSFASAESLIRVVAIPSNTAIKTSPKNLVYTWKRNNKTVQAASGYGKDSYTFQNSELSNEEVISVTASTVDGSYNATKTINIPIINPKIIFYKKSPTEGVLYNNALQDETFLAEDEMTLVAVPYFLATSGKENNFSYGWKLNDKDIDTPSKKTELTIRPASRGGYATISLVIENLNTFFQKVSGELKLNI